MGDHIILLIDGNSNMKNSDLKNTLEEECTLTEAIMAKHGTNGPSTFRRNNTKNPIDGIWVSPSLSIQAGGYFAYDTLIMNTDHRCLWVDIAYTTAFGHNMPAIVRPAARRLHCKDPRLVANYVRAYKNFIKKHRLSAKVKKLKEEASYPLDELGKFTLEEIDSLRCKGVAMAEKKCHKLRMGQEAFSPQLQQASRAIKAWSLLEKKERGCE